MANTRTGKPLKQAIEHHMDAQGALIEQKPHLKKEHEIDHLYLAIDEKDDSLRKQQETILIELFKLLPDTPFVRHQLKQFMEIQRKRDELEKLDDRLHREDLAVNSLIDMCNERALEALREANQDLEGVIRVISKALGYSHTLPAGPEFPRTPPPAPARGRRSRKPRKKKCG